MAQFAQMIWPLLAVSGGEGLFINCMTKNGGNYISDCKYIFTYFMSDYSVSYCVSVLKIFIYIFVNTNICQYIYIYIFFCGANIYTKNLK